MIPNLYVSLNEKREIGELGLDTGACVLICPDRREARCVRQDIFTPGSYFAILSDKLLRPSPIFVSFTVECVSWVGRSVGLKKRTSKKSLKKSRKKRPGTP